ncbi:hypothetical protein SELMODRAFT_409608 [Selaginella moellendorffii]|uniref:BAHD family acyltransferase, clade V n=1 Tax=Selaginella moellendorffii TaxID=88036 RepID=D8RBZ9_SELML|nr:hypothetical protein SELMODRAFT_409608 [Selaginella moellendorffii]
MEIHSRMCVAKSDVPASVPRVVLLSPLDLFHTSQMPIILFYENAPAGAAARIESGLATVLDHYPELAGRIGRDELGRHCIHLNNEGAIFVEAVCSSELAPFLDKRGNDVKDLVGSSTLELGDGMNRVPLIIQVTRFACGGLALSWEGHHRVCDGSAHAQFLLNWASAARTGSLTPGFVPLIHDRYFLFPRNPPVVEDPLVKFIHKQMSRTTVPGQEVLTLTANLTSKQISHLKSLCGNKYTTYETLSAHFWRCMTAARDFEDRSTLVGHFCPANGRSILNAPSGFFGNAIYLTFVQTSAADLLDGSLEHAAGLIRQGVKRASNRVFLESVIDYLALEQASEDAQPPQAEAKDQSWIPNVMIPCWSKFPLYEVDFGFGNPFRFSTVNMGIEGAFTIGPPRKDGITEVLINVRKEHAQSLVTHLGNCTQGYF